MILGAEIGLVIWGIYALITGKLTLGKTRVVRGTAARLLALIALLPFPLAFMVGVVIGTMVAVRGGNFNDLQVPLILIELGLVIGCVILIYAIGWPLGEPPGQDQARVDALLDRFDEEDEDDDPPPRRRRSRPPPADDDDDGRFQRKSRS